MNQGDELKFSCPVCGQHISCGKTCGGQAIHCPNCCAELRIPLVGAGNGELSSVKAELIHSSHHNNAGANITGAMDGNELHCRCPVCQSKLRIPASTAAQSADIFPSAELVAKPSETLADPAKPAASAAPMAAGFSMTEREKKIAAERAIRSVSPYPQMKPRLDLVLGGKSSGKADSPSDEETKRWT